MLNLSHFCLYILPSFLKRIISILYSKLLYFIKNSGTCILHGRRNRRFIKTTCMYIGYVMQQIMQLFDIKCFMGFPAVVLRKRFLLSNLEYWLQRQFKTLLLLEANVYFPTRTISDYVCSIIIFSTPESHQVQV